MLLLLTLQSSHMFRLSLLPLRTYDSPLTKPRNFNCFCNRTSMSFPDREILNVNAPKHLSKFYIDAFISLKSRNNMRFLVL